MAVGGADFSAASISEREGGVHIECSHSFTIAVGRKLVRVERGKAWVDIQELVSICCTMGETPLEHGDPSTARMKMTAKHVAHILRPRNL